MFQKDFFFESSLSFNLTDPLKVLSIDVSHEIFDWWWHHNINGKTWRYRGSLVILQRSSMKRTKKDFPFLIFNLIGLFYKKYMTKNVTWKIVVLEKIFEKETPGNTNLTMYYDGSFKKLLQTMPKINFSFTLHWQKIFRSTFCNESFGSLRSRWA